MKPTRFDKILNALSAVLLIGTVLVVVLYWNRLPEQVPIRYDFAGNVTGWGGKGSLLILPAISVVFYMIFTFVEHTSPESWNTGVKVTAQNKEWVYANIRHLMSTTKLLFILLFAILTYYQVTQRPLNMLLPTAEVLLSFGNVIFWMVRAAKKKR